MLNSTPVFDAPSSWPAPTAICASSPAALDCQELQIFAPLCAGWLAFNNHMKIWYHFQHFKEEIETLLIDTDPN